MAHRRYLQANTMGSLPLYAIVVLAWQRTGIHAASLDPNVPNCTEISFTSPGWIIPALVTTHVNDSGPIGSIYFSVEHHPTNSSTVCSAEGWIEQVTEEDAVELVWYSCATPETEFQFDPETSQLTLQTNWTCEILRTLEFSAIGSTIIPRGPPCPETGEGEPDCVPRNIEVKAKLTSPVELQPSGPQLPDRSCTIHSFNMSSMLLQGYEIEAFTNTSDGAPLTDLRTNATFTVYNDGPGDTYRIPVIDVPTDGIWHECSPESGAQLVICQYLLDRAQGILAFEMQWSCDDLDPQHAILFTATAVAQLPGEECDTLKGWESESLIRCHLPRNSSTAVLNIDSFTWESSVGLMHRGLPSSASLAP
ncbi:hypothetical protein GGR53DRAFT_479573 [Hypoxylon sp. FL1150]|nr:hypothetical protein GGR53DRAFT_479573 [Hypoxylon sp. FL1150]